jgi:carbamoylphosphate synthase large subunit
MRVLITDAYTKHAIALAKYIRRDCKDIQLIGHLNNSNLNERFLRILGRLFYDEIFIGSLPEIIKEENFDFVIPVWAESVTDTAKSRTAKCIIPSKEAIHLCLSKTKTTETAKELGIPVPRTFYGTTIEELDSLEISFPCVVKSESELQKEPVQYCSNKSELEDALKSYKSNVIIQEYIIGSGVGFFAFYEKGILKRFYIHKRIREYPITGGPSVAAQTIYDERIFNYGKKLLDYLKWNGVAMVEFKYDFKTGTINLMEINPKFWGSTELGLKAGVNFGQLLINSYKGVQIETNHKENSYKKINFFWPIDNDFLSIVKYKKIAFALDYFRGGYYTNITSKYLILKFSLIIARLINKI